MGQRFTQNYLGVRMAGVNTPREVYKGELVTPIRENADVPHNDGHEHQHKLIQDGIPSNPSPDED